MSDGLIPNHDDVFGQGGFCPDSHESPRPGTNNQGRPTRDPRPLKENRVAATAKCPYASCGKTVGLNPDGTLKAHRPPNAPLSAPLCNGTNQNPSR